MCNIRLDLRVYDTIRRHKEDAMRLRLLRNGGTGLRRIVTLNGSGHHDRMNTSLLGTVIAIFSSLFSARLGLHILFFSKRRAWLLLSDGSFSA